MRPRARAALKSGGLQLASTPVQSTLAPSPYFLEVKLTVAKSVVPAYRDLAPAAVDAIQQKTPLRLAVAAQSLSGTEFLHLWTMPEADSLRNSMIEMVDDVPYNRLDRLVDTEDQDLLTPVGYVPTPRPPQQASYLHVSGLVHSRDLPEFQAIYEAAPPLFQRKHGAVFYGAFLNISGRVNRVTSLWGLAANKGISSESLRELPGLNLLNDVDASQWLAASYQP